MVNSSSQTENVLHRTNNFMLIESFVHIHYNKLQTCLLILDDCSRLEISRIYSYISADKGGPKTVCIAAILNSGILEFSISSEIVETSVCFTPLIQFKSYTCEELIKALEKLNDQHTYCSGGVQCSL